MTGTSIAKVSTAPGVANLHIWLLCVRYELYKVELHESHLFWLSCIVLGELLFVSITRCHLFFCSVHLQIL